VQGVRHWKCVFVLHQCFGGFEQLIRGRTLTIGVVGLLLGGSLHIVFVIECDIVEMGLDKMCLLCRGR